MRSVLAGKARAPKIRQTYIGRASWEQANAFPLLVSTERPWIGYATDVTVEKTNEIYQVAQTQTHSSYEGRTEVVKEMTLGDFKKAPE